ncbi:TIGR00153 family protein [Marichromatium bheemlicum]|uniref:TIGR00153 family protein n=1 Tax=Marichromatium bheemlicum TaxID=365339 RepID=A0ABX1I7S6_9GAMM|nr:TIGR00153 family protein [Marichromatium bheemlicum]NKN32265.1 TIGR00153 family protein [Marichromatium bheemlicum]
MKPSNPIADLFGRSPFKPMQEHMHLVDACVALLPELFAALIEGDRERLEHAQRAIVDQEHAADQAKNRIRLRLPRSLFMPVDRRDLLAVLETQDAIADTAQEIAGVLVQRQMPLPAVMKSDLTALVERCIDACGQASRVVDELDELLETGFRGREAARVEEMVETLCDIESETDALVASLNRTLFAHETELDPVSVVFWYRLIERIGDLADHAEKVGERLLLLIAR